MEYSGAIYLKVNSDSITIVTHLIKITNLDYCFIAGIIIPNFSFLLFLSVYPLISYTG